MMTTTLKQRSCLLFLYAMLISVGTLAQSFIHPGILHSDADFKVLKDIVTRQSLPAYGSYRLLKSDQKASFNYKMLGPFKVISRDGPFAFTKPKMESDFSAAYLNTIQWMVTGDERHAATAMSILLAYADSLKEIPATNDAPLLAGLEGFKILYAAEALRYSYPPFSGASLQKVTSLITSLFLPIMERFYSMPAYTNGNWGAIVTKAYMAAGIYLDNRNMYKKAIAFYLDGKDNGTIRNYISEVTGQIQESGRDQGHSQLGIGALATVCEVAYLQGDDLYSAFNNRLLKGFEYVAKYNLGDDDVPFELWKDVTGKYSNWKVISTLSRGKFQPVYEMAYHHYVYRKGLKMPYTLKVIDKIRPEGFDRDQPGFGTFLFSGR